MKKTIYKCDICGSESQDAEFLIDTHNFIISFSGIENQYTFGELCEKCEDKTVKFFRKIKEQIGCQCEALRKEILNDNRTN